MKNQFVLPALIIGIALVVVVYVLTNNSSKFPPPMAQSSNLVNPPNITKQSPTESNSTSDSLALKQQCRDAGDKHLARFNQQKYNDGESYSLLGAVYNQKLNTCVAEIYWTSGNRKRELYNIYDELSGILLANWTHNGTLGNEIPSYLQDSCMTSDKACADFLDFKKYETSLGFSQY